MILTYKYRIYPTKHQIFILNNTLETCRVLYNDILSIRKNSFENEHKSVSLYDTTNMLPEMKKHKPELTKVHSRVLQDVCIRVDLAYQSFFRRIKRKENPGYPRFRGEGRYNSFTYSQTGFSIENHKLILSKIGNVKIKLHRPINGIIKKLIINKTASNKWFACFCCDVPQYTLPQGDKAVGIDVGLEKFATLSTGETIENPRFFRKKEKQLAKAKRKLSKSEKETKEYFKRKIIVVKIYQKVCNQRKDFAHKLSRQFVNNYNIISFEKLDIQRMLQNHNLAKSIADASWHQFIQYTTYKAEWAGRSVVLVDPRGTSQRCSRCGTIVKKSLDIRIHSCLVCGLVMSRDQNAAINILALGLQCLGVNPKSPNHVVREYSL